jgi:hypothetical protein
MDGRELPGFYYDREKRKYFKIQQSHNAPSQGSKHTLPRIKQELKQDRAEEEQAINTTKRQAETIVRRYFRDPLLQASLDREIGLRSVSYYVRNIWSDACAVSLYREATKDVESPDHSGVIRHFDRDPISKTLYVVHGDNKIKRRRINGPNIPSPYTESSEDGQTALNEYSFEPWDQLAKLTSSVSSLTYLPASGALAATTYGSDRPPVVCLSDPDRDGPYVNQKFTPKNTSTIWAAAARPTSLATSNDVASNSVAATDTEHLAVAASSSLRLFTRSPTGAWDSETVLKTSTDVLAVDWLSPTVLTLGERSGKIHLYDIRSRGSSHVLTHPTPVVRVRRADDPTRIVSAGLQDTLFLYDIRSPRFSNTSSGEHQDQYYNQQYFATREQETRIWNKRRKRSHATLKWSQPVLSFQHHNSDNMYMDFQVHPRLGLVAAAQDSMTAHTVLKLHNLWTGKVIKDISPGSYPTVRPQTKVCCLKFMDDEQTGEVRSFCDSIEFHSVGAFFETTGIDAPWMSCTDRCIDQFMGEFDRGHQKIPVVTVRAYRPR